MQYLEQDQYDENASVTAVLGLSPVGLAVIYLGLAFTENGGNPAQIEAFLTDLGMDPLLAAIQNKPVLRAYTKEKCTPAITRLLEFK